MTHYKIRLENDLQTIRDLLSSVANQVNLSVQNAVNAIMVLDKDALYNVMLEDPEVNRKTRKLDSLCHSFIARHLPAAKPLRFVSSVLRLSIALERIGDYSVTLARVGVRLEQSPPELMRKDLQKVSNRSCKMVVQAIKAFVEEDAALAKETARMSRKVDKRHDKFFEKVSKEDNPVVLQVVRLLTIMSKLERVSDQAKNMCEEALFVTTGETKAPKSPKILFVDEKNNLHSQLALLLAKKSFPDTGKYFSSGWAPENTISPQLEEALEMFGLELESFSTTEVQPFRQAMAEYNVIVVINGGPNPPLSTIPFHSILLQWNFDENMAIEDLARILATKITELMTKLCGTEAS